jgi:hypothetical protein
MNYCIGEETKGGCFKASTCNNYPTFCGECPLNQSLSKCNTMDNTNGQSDNDEEDIERFDLNTAFDSMQIAISVFN